MHEVELYQTKLIMRLLQIRTTYEAHGCECQAKAIDTCIEEVRKPLRINDKPHVVKPMPTVK